MSREIHALTISDLSSFARALRESLGKREAPPSHVEMVNLLSKSAGYRNYQHFRAQEERRSEVPRPEPVDHDLIERVARHFDGAGVLMRWPAKNSLQPLCLWALWSRMEAGRTYPDAEMTALLNRWASFGDHALLRRALVSLGYAVRSKDGRIYRRIEQKPPAELSPLLRRVMRTQGAV
ncbi:hypothetical protein ASG47_14525 [Devosia sp. Leaf420]|uniref:DUF2087 domain-containing protein n=1 Tax=Devosia sp. Leaf420 TaxID=1736374 RepID=UPI000716010F|nr:DUF2087 domain-containing protein [Devosia sp. Leaf420]KQT44664.1 hypothetical protein ASG47_14525 [Devosia sp. Leaf420]